MWVIHVVSSLFLCFPSFRTRIFRVYARKVEVCDDDFKLHCNNQFGTTCSSRVFGSSLCLKVLLVGASVAVIVRSKWLLAAHPQVLPEWKMPSCVSAADTNAQCSSATDARNLRSMLLQERRKRLHVGLLQWRPKLAKCFCRTSISSARSMTH